MNSLCRREAALAALPLVPPAWKEHAGAGAPLEPDQVAKAESLRDRIMRNVGTDEPWVVEEMSKMLGEMAIAVHYRRPLRIDEINRMALTDAVKSSPGRG
jgi:hypothetical protein